MSGFKTVFLGLIFILAADVNASEAVSEKEFSDLVQTWCKDLSGKDLPVKLPTLSPLVCADGKPTPFASKLQKQVPKDKKSVKESLLFVSEKDGSFTAGMSFATRHPPEILNRIVAKYYSSVPDLRRQLPKLKSVKIKKVLKVKPEDYKPTGSEAALEYVPDQSQKAKVVAFDAIMNLYHLKENISSIGLVLSTESKSGVTHLEKHWPIMKREKKGSLLIFAMLITPKDSADDKSYREIAVEFAERMFSLSNLTDGQVQSMLR